MGDGLIRKRQAEKDAVMESEAHGRKRWPLALRMGRRPGATECGRLWRLWQAGDGPSAPPRKTRPAANTSRPSVCVALATTLW